MESTSLSLLSKVRRHDEAAWSELVRIYAPLVIHWCRQYNIPSADVDDIVQTVFMAVYHHLGRYGQNEEQNNFRGWLWTITRSKILDHLRKKRTLPIASANSHLESLEGFCDSVANNRSTEDARHDLLILVNQTLGQIRRDFSEKTWTAFWRVTALGESPSLVAEDLGMTIAAVCMCRSRVLRRLRETINDA